MNCLYCGKEFPKRGIKKFCCNEHLVRYKTELRSRKRAEARKRETRICPECGRTFEWTNLCAEKVYCTPACKDRHEARISHARRGSRKDAILLKFDAAPDPSLDGMRDAKGPEYFRAVFALPKETQYAEMAAWTPDDHASAMEYLSAATVFGIDDGDDEEEITVEEVDGRPYDEEDHSGD